MERGHSPSYRVTNETAAVRIISTMDSVHARGRALLASMVPAHQAPGGSALVALGPPLRRGLRQLPDVACHRGGREEIADGLH